jgi:hypothetical protein
MNPEFIYKSAKVCFWLSLLGFLFGTVYWGVGFGFGFLSGALWSTANLCLLTLLAGLVFQERVNKMKVLLVAAAKFLGLYGAGYLILRFCGFSIYGTMIGFSLPFIVIVLKVLGRRAAVHD